MEIEADPEKWKKFTEKHELQVHAGRWQRKQDSENNRKTDADLARSEAVQTKIGMKRPASNDDDQAPAKHMPRIDNPQGEKRKIEPNQDASEPSKLSKLNMSKLNRKDKQILGELSNIARAREGPDVTEIYSPPRVTQHAEQFGLTGGWSLD